MKSLSGVITSPVLVFLLTWEMDSCAHVVSVSQSVSSLLHAADLYNTKHSGVTAISSHVPCSEAIDMETIGCVAVNWL